jgi:hypothetical protein
LKAHKTRFYEEHNKHDQSLERLTGYIPLLLNMTILSTINQRPILGLKKVAVAQKWLLFRGRVLKNYYQYCKAGDHAEQCRKVVVVQRWSLAQD